MLAVTCIIPPVLITHQSLCLASTALAETLLYLSHYSLSVVVRRLANNVYWRQNASLIFSQRSFEIFFPSGKYLASYTRDARKKQAGRPQAKCLLQQLHWCPRILAQSISLDLTQIRPAFLDLTSTSTTGLYERAVSQVQNLGGHNPFQINVAPVSDSRNVQF
jgi:hypothetical protein